LELKHAIIVVVIMFSLYMISVSGGYSLMGFIKDIPPLKGDNYTEWKKKIDLAFVLAKVDWVVTTPCPSEPVAPVRETNESDADWQKRETMLLYRWYMTCKSKIGSMLIKSVLLS
jgi:hypothetical protein